MKKKLAVAAAAALCAGGVMLSGVTARGADQSGEALFKQHCVICHVDGGNIVNAQKTLHKKDREANNVKTVADILKIARNPGPGMTKFDKKTLSDKDARKIAEYILKTF